MLRKFTNKKLPLAFILISICYLSLRLPGLGTDILNSDGARWYRRSTNFLEALENNNLQSTYQHYQPGITLMWIRSLIEKTTWAIQNMLGMSHWYLENYIFFTHIHMITKTTLIFILLFIFLFQIIIIQKIFGTKTTVIFGLLVSLEPYLIGIDRWFHLTSLEAYFSFSAFLSILYWCKISSSKNKSKFFLILGGIFLGLSILSKVTGLITLLPIFFIFLQYLFTNQKNKKFSSTILYIGIFSLSLAITIFIFFPALWVNPLFVLNKIFNSINNATKITSANHLNTLINNFSYYPNILIYKLSPITIAFFLVFLLNTVIKKAKNLTLYIYAIIFYFLSFYLLLSLSSKKIDRYSIELFFPILLLISIHLADIKNKLLIYFGIFSFLLYTYSYLINYPVLSGYYSPLLGGESGAIKRGYYDNSGEYFAQAALFLNRYDKTNIYIPDNFESFKYFSKHNIVSQQSSVSYSLFSLDTDRKNPPKELCGPLYKSFGPKFNVPVVYIYKCNN